MRIRIQRIISAQIKNYFKMEDIQKTFSILTPYILRYWKAYLALFLLLWLDIAMTLVFAWFFGTVTDAAIHSEFHKLKWLVPLGIALLLVSISSTFLNVRFETTATNRVKNDLKNDLLKHIMLLPLKHSSSLRSGDLLSHFSNDIHYLDGVIGSSLIDLVRLPLIYAAVFVYLVQINWRLSLICLLVAPLAVFTSAIFGLWLRRNSRMMQGLLGDMSNLLNEAFHGLLIIRSFALEQWLHKKYNAQNQELFALELQNAKLRGWFHTGSYAVSSIIFLISLCLGAYYISKQAMSVGSLLTFINLVNHLVFPLTGLAAQWAGIQRSFSAVERICNILEQQTETVQFPARLSSRTQVNSIQFYNVSFNYDGQINIFDRFHLHIPTGKVVAIVGQSGAGKTTLFHLLQGLYKPDAGKVWINGVATDTLSLSELRSYFAYVPQETFLFDASIRENLQLARQDLTEIEMMHAAAIANIHDYIMSLPKGYDTQIGEQGIALSGGQKQRMAIARALLKDAPILLLDEATSALDNETEFQVKEALEQLMNGRTTLIIAHRLSTIRSADWIIVMNKGEIVQTGRHEELISKDGPYRNLISTQFPMQREAGVVV